MGTLIMKTNNVVNNYSYPFLINESNPKVERFRLETIDDGCLVRLKFSSKDLLIK